ncbi:alpha/beta fold hydrolase [Duganella sp. LjRoot269]|uniref:alpha/beta fold hydrolase n=1 Tax=Duganella sp. LjRoot269 TaxID=3342305 RepID=UPI003ECFDEBC
MDTGNQPPLVISNTPVGACAVSFMNKLAQGGSLNQRTRVRIAIYLAKRGCSVFPLDLLREYGRAAGMNSAEMTANERGTSHDAMATACLRFVQSIVASPTTPTPEDLQGMYDVGYTLNEILEVMAQVSTNIPTPLTGGFMKAIAATAVAVSLSVASLAQAAPVAYRTVKVDNINIAYREAGDASKPTILLLHGVPSSSRMYDALLRKLGDEYHLVAPDYPGFGNSDAPDPAGFTYTFDHLAQVMQKFTDAVGARRYVLLMQDYGAPVGMRMAIARPDAIQALVFQNGNVYEDGLGAIWEKRKPFWTDRAAHEKDVIAAHQSVATTRARHIGTDPNVEAYDPDLWMDEYAYLNRPGQARIQTDLIYDYQHNLAAYPQWQSWLKQRQLPTLVVWGKHDTAFTVPGAQAFRRDNPAAEVHILDGGHFVMDTQLDAVAKVTRAFMHRLETATSGAKP